MHSLYCHYDGYWLYDSDIFLHNIILEWDVPALTSTLRSHVVPSRRPCNVSDVSGQLHHDGVLHSKILLLPDRIMLIVISNKPL